MTFEVIKANKRLWIRQVETGELVYTPPDFIRHRLQSRLPMEQLAESFNKVGERAISAIAELEARYSPRR